MITRLGKAFKAAMGGNSMMDSREPIKVAEIIEKYPKGISITGIAKNSFNGSTYPIFTFAEDPSKYFSGATALSQFVERLLDDYDGDMAALNEDLQKEYVRIKLVKTKTKRGYNFTKVIGLGLIPASEFRKQNGGQILFEEGDDEDGDEDKSGGKKSENPFKGMVVDKSGTIYNPETGELVGFMD